MHIKIYWSNNYFSIGMVNWKKWNKTKQFQQNKNKWNNQNYIKLPIVTLWLVLKHDQIENMDSWQCYTQRISLILGNAK